MYSLSHKLFSLLITAITFFVLFGLTFVPEVGASSTILEQTEKVSQLQIDDVATTNDNLSLEDSTSSFTSGDSSLLSGDTAKTFNTNSFVSSLENNSNPNTYPNQFPAIPVTPNNGIMPQTQTLVLSQYRSIPNIVKDFINTSLTPSAEETLHTVALFGNIALLFLLSRLRLRSGRSPGELYVVSFN